MKLPVPDEVLQRLDTAEANMVALRESMERVEALLTLLVEIQQEALDRLPPL